MRQLNYSAYKKFLIKHAETFSSLLANTNIFEWKPFIVLVNSIEKHNQEQPS